MISRRTLMTSAASLMAVPAFARSKPAPIVDFSLGAEDAPVQVIEYASFTCVHCATFHAEGYQKLKRDHIETGNVRFTLREVYFDRYGLWAAMVARCGGINRYFGIADMIMEKQKDWTSHEDPAEVIAHLKRIGISAGLGVSELDYCLSDQDTAKALVAHFEANMTEYPIQGTPAFVIDGTLHANLAYEEMAGLIEKARL